MDIATGAMSSLLPKLGELLLEEYKLQKGAKREIQELQKELTSMNAALCRVSEVPMDQLDELVKIWARDVRELSYDIEDAIDNFMVQGEEQKSTKTFSFKGLIDRTTDLFNKGLTRHQIAKEIKDIKRLVKEASDRRDRYKVDDVAPRLEKVTIDPRLEAIYRKINEIVGIEGPKNELAKRLMGEDASLTQQPMAVSIVGFGGLGKTTLANALLYELRAEFDCNFFVTVSLKPDIKNILKNILGQLDRAGNTEVWDEKHLIDEIRRLTKNKRCLWVIDDIWEESAWDIIKLALQDGNPGSKIITTTRKMAVANRVGGYVHDLKPLTGTDSMKLLSKRIFDSEDGCPPDLREVTVKILQKCAGVPLAIITIASLLASKKLQLHEWDKVNKSIGSGLGNSIDVGNMRKILSLSYYDLPSPLKTCLLYLSKYPEGKKIGKDILVWSWIAEGFITDKGQHGTSLHEIGEGYFNELINRSLIHPVDIFLRFYDQDGQVHACQVHDMVLELLNQLSAEECFITTLLSDDQQAVRSMMQKETRIRRLSLHSSVNTYTSKEAREHSPKVRSLTVFGNVDSWPPLLCFRVLRVLQLENCIAIKNKHLRHLGELNRLRFLSLRNITKLPESIGNLQFLQTLDIRGASSVIQLPPCFVNLAQLVRLIGDKVNLPSGVSLAKMKSLQELVGIYVTKNNDMEGIGDLTELRVLKIQIFGRMESNSNNLREAFLSCLQRCNNLQDLNIQTQGGIFFLDFLLEAPSSLRRFMSNGFFRKALPAWINSSLSCLTTLTIRLFSCGMSQEYLVTLSEFPCLRYLKIQALGQPQQKERLTISGGASAFRNLKDLHFYCGVMGLTFQPTAMPRLQKLCLYFNETVTFRLYGKFYFGMMNLRDLRHVTVELLGGPYLEAEAVIRNELNSHPNHPLFDVVKN